MPVENSVWLIPVAKEAYDHRQEILSTWERISAALFGKKRSVIFTGMPGVGKTVLFDHLSGKAYNQGYQPPLTSTVVEAGRMRTRKERVRISVIPGQEAANRLVALNELFLGKRAVNGVVHVVANGFITLRGSTAKQVLVEEGKLTTIDQYRAHQLRQELQDLDATCQIVRQSLLKHRKPTWMLIAVSKADLYYESIAQVESYYSPSGTGPVVDRLRKLQDQVGRDNFSWDAAPVSAWLEDFEWNNEKRLSILKPDDRDYLVSKFARHLERFCE